VELLNFMHQSKTHKKTPVIILRLHATERDEFLKTTMDSLLKTKSICEYLETNEDPGFTIQLRQSVAKHLRIESYLLQPASEN
jgi:hypothetical protein